jgi:outer membrane protein
MTRFQALFLIAAALLVSPLLLPARAGVPQQVKVGVVDFEKTMLTTPAGKRAGAQVLAAKKAKQDAFDKRKNDFLAKNKAFDATKATLKPDDAQKQQAVLMQEYGELGKLAQTLERDLADENAKAVEALMQQAEPIIKQLAQAEGCTLIVDARELVWIDPALDLTERLDAQMK